MKRNLLGSDPIWWVTYKKRQLEHTEEGRPGIQAHWGKPCGDILRKEPPASQRKASAKQPADSWWDVELLNPRTISKHISVVQVSHIVHGVWLWGPQQMHTPALTPPAVRHTPRIERISVSVVGLQGISGVNKCLFSLTVFLFLKKQSPVITELQPRG